MTAAAPEASEVRWGAEERPPPARIAPYGAMHCPRCGGLRPAPHPWTPERFSACRSCRVAEGDYREPVFAEAEP